MTIVELANLSMVSRQSLHSIERGETTPTPLTLQAISEALRFDVEFFQQEGISIPNREVLHFRRKARVPVRTIEHVLARVGLFASVVEYIRSLGRFPQNVIPDIKVATPNDIQDAATKCRAALSVRGDTPISGLTRLLERSGAFVGLFSGDDVSVDALSWVKNEPIVLRSSNVSTSRARFSLAHELGHLVMHNGKATGDEQTETQAHRFASAFLIPQAPMRQEFPRYGTQINWDGLIRMKTDWGISIQALLHYAYDLGIIDTAKYRAACIRVSQLGWKTAEPGEPSYVEEPDLLPRAMAGLRERLHLGHAEIARHLRLAVDVIEDITGVAAPLANVVRLGLREVAQG